jgi:hypothetical protein
MKRPWKTWRPRLRGPQGPMSKAKMRGYENALYGVADYLVLPIGGWRIFSYTELFGVRS